MSKRFGRNKRRLLIQKHKKEIEQLEAQINSWATTVQSSFLMSNPKFTKSLREMETEVYSCKGTKESLSFYGSNVNIINALVDTVTINSDLS